MKLDRFINRPVLSTVISVLIVILGIIGLATLPVTQYPDIAPPTVQVRATYTGANSTAVLNSVIAPLEDQINGVENMMYIQSSASNNGAADINVYFNQGTDPDMAAVNSSFFSLSFFLSLKSRVPALRPELMKARVNARRK